MRQYRDRGAIGALLDEYEKSIEELIAVIIKVNDSELKEIVDPITDDEDCRSIQTILTHVISSGYYYGTMILNHQGENNSIIPKQTLSTSDQYKEALLKMFEYNAEIFEQYPNMKLEELNNDLKIKTRWNQSYDVEQLLEHAIVHILRHRRQIERFLIKLKR